jgi:hypothetical protein
VTALLIQPKFATQSQSYGTPMGSPSTDVFRGYMIWDQGSSNGGLGLGYTGGQHSDGRDIINFQFNPSTVDTSYSVNNASLQAAELFPVPGSTNVLLAPLQQFVSFNLYYDRLYELNYGTGANGAGTGLPNDPAVIGCQADVLQFMQFTGQLASNLNSGVQSVLDGTTAGTQSATGSAVTAAQINSTLGGGGIMMMIPAWIYFASAAPDSVSSKSINFSSVAARLNYFGYVSSWSVEYTHWTAQMIPIRCVISVSFTLLPNGSSIGFAGVAADTGGGPNVTPLAQLPNPNGALTKIITETNNPSGIGGR